LKRTLRDMRGMAWLKSRTRTFTVMDLQTNLSTESAGNH
jgi:hypothetical protein